jgi:hypothetical protein
MYLGAWLTAIARYKWVDRVRDASRYSALALDEEFVVRAVAHERCERAGGEEGGDGGVTHDLERHIVGHLGFAQPCGGVLEGAALSGGPHLLGDRALEELRAHLAHERRIDSGGDLQIGRVLPCREVVGESLEPESPDALLEGGHQRLPRVESVAQRRQAVQCLLARRCEQPHVHADDVVPFAEGRHTERHGLSRVRLGPVRAVGHRRTRLHEGYPPHDGGSLGLPFGGGTDRDGCRAPDGTGARGARRRDHHSNLPRGRPHVRNALTPSGTGASMSGRSG